MFVPRGPGAGPSPTTKSTLHLLFSFVLGITTRAHIVDFTRPPRTHYLLGCLEVNHGYLSTISFFSVLHFWTWSHVTYIGQMSCT